METTSIGTEKAQWDLDVLYSGINDPRLDQDLSELIAREKKFYGDYKGRLAQKLGAAIVDYAEIGMLTNKLFLYLYLQQSLDVANGAVKAKIADVERAANATAGEFLTFFTLELVGLDDGTLQKFYASDPIVKKHQPWIEHARIFKPHLLSEPVEGALTKRSPFGPGAWSEFFDEVEADLRFPFQNSQKTLTEMLDILTNSPDAGARASALETIHAGLGGPFAKYAAQTFYVVAGGEGVEIKERGYKSPMDPQNKSNRIPDAVVEALHIAVKDIGGPLAKRYYNLKARLLDMPKLAWSDRNAPMPFKDMATMPFDAAMALVIEAYQSFSPTLADIVRDLSNNHRIDAAATPGKRSGAFNYSVVLPGNIPSSFVLLNYLGSTRDVMTIAHELGHAVHGVLAGAAQGPLMSQAPIAYAETASVFGEMTTFNFLKKRLEAAGNPHALLALITSKIEDTLNSVVRQIGFSNFERQLHGMDADYHEWREPKKRSVEELDALWLTTLSELYGADGEVFTYKNAGHLWTYVAHFNRPFYVYGYAFGELLTHSLYAQQATLGDRFESLYLDLLRSGSTKNVVELLKPFNLDPVNPAFWADGLRVSLQAMIEQAEALAPRTKATPRIV
jgi:oligoendopeptidase F